MVKQQPLRKLISRAAVVVAGVIFDGRNLDQLLAREQPDGRPAVQDMAYSVLRELGRLSAVRDLALSRPLRDERVAVLLLVALHLLDAGRTEAHVVVNEAVAAAADWHAWARGLVNAVLRRVLREQLLATAFETPVARWNYPEWWIRRLSVSFPQQWQGILAAGNGHPPLYLRVNQRRTSPEAYLADLHDAGISATLAGQSAIRLDRPVPVDRLPGFLAGDVSVQDLAAQHAARLLDAQSGMRVLDACAAPGGKTGHLLELADIKLQALDADRQRLQRVQANLDRLGLSAQLRAGDAAQPQDWWDGVPFERILADVPCSASGVVRRHPDIRWLRREGDIAGFVRQQARILDALWGCLACGGKLLYVTCSVFAEENGEQINRFLAQNPDARRLTLALDDDHDGQLLPDESGDGFYYALLEKI